MNRISYTFSQEVKDKHIIEYMHGDKWNIEYISIYMFCWNILLHLINESLVKFNSRWELKNNNIKLTNEEYNQLFEHWTDQLYLLMNSLTNNLKLTFELTLSLYNIIFWVLEILILPKLRIYLIMINFLILTLKKFQNNLTNKCTHNLWDCMLNNKKKKFFQNIHNT